MSEGCCKGAVALFAPSVLRQRRKALSDSSRHLETFRSVPRHRLKALMHRQRPGMCSFLLTFRHDPHYSARRSKCFASTSAVPRWFLLIRLYHSSQLFAQIGRASAKRIWPGAKRKAHKDSPASCPSPLRPAPLSTSPYLFALSGEHAVALVR